MVELTVVVSAFQAFALQADVYRGLSASAERVTARWAFIRS